MHEQSEILTLPLTTGKAISEQEQGSRRNMKEATLDTSSHRVFFVSLFVF